MAAIRRCADPAQLDRALEALGPGEALLLFFGSEDPATGASWCPDCVLADPVLRASCARLRSDLPLLECPVGPRQAWKGRPAHPYRADPRFGIARIPTLVLWRAGRAAGRLVEAACSDPDALEAFLRGGGGLP